jgi:hypothetical protein
MLGALIMWLIVQAIGPGSDAIVLHRAGNPPETYIAKFDALGSAAANTVSCMEFKGFVEKLSPETGPVNCSPLN